MQSCYLSAQAKFRLEINAHRYLSSSPFCLSCEDLPVDKEDQLKRLNYVCVLFHDQDAKQWLVVGAKGGWLVGVDDFFLIDRVDVSSSSFAAGSKVRTVFLHRSRCL
jgi:hypothetical protein